MIDTEGLIASASRYASRHMPVFMDREDLEQEARLAFLLKPPTEGSDAAHTENLTRRRAFSAMIDALRTGFHARRGTHLFISLDDTNEDGSPANAYLYDPVANDDPMRTAMVKQAVDRLYRKASPRLRECLDMLAQDMDQQDIAAVMNLTPSRVCQLVREARAILSTCL